MRRTNIHLLRPQFDALPQPPSSLSRTRALRGLAEQQDFQLERWWAGRGEAHGARHQTTTVKGEAMGRRTERPGDNVAPPKGTGTPPAEIGKDGEGVRPRAGSFGLRGWRAGLVCGHGTQGDPLADAPTDRSRPSRREQHPHHYERKLGSHTLSGVNGRGGAINQVTCRDCTSCVVVRRRPIMDGPMGRPTAAVVSEGMVRSRPRAPGTCASDVRCCRHRTGQGQSRLGIIDTGCSRSVVDCRRDTSVRGAQLAEVNCGRPLGDDVARPRGLGAMQFQLKP